jgi:flagellar biosynthesis protein FliR
MKTVFGNMYKLFPDFNFFVFSFSLSLVFKTVCQTHINNTEMRFAVLETEKLFPKQLPNMSRKKGKR